MPCWLGCFPHALAPPTTHSSSLITMSAGALVQTAALAQRTSETVSILAAREDALEKNLEEMHHILLRMQENQTKQLELISTLGKLVKDRPRNKGERSNKAGFSNLLGVKLQQVGEERVAKNSNDDCQIKATGKRSGSAESNSMENKSSNLSFAQAGRQRNIERSPSKPNCLDRDVDFWLSTPLSSSPHVGEPTADINIKNRKLNDGRPRAAFMD
ncbi:hypothetical protein L7F22_065432 [Adiantum nelumboides]|nr:hypothetical protein [Adiantum nelumboides]